MTEAAEKKQQGGKREGAGPPLKGSDKRSMVSLRLDPYLIKRLKETKESQADQIDRALRGFYGW